MSELLFCTGNGDKFALARQVCEPYGIGITQQALKVTEIQSEDAEAILLDKMQKAYGMIGRPLVVSDDSWEIPALRGFPGPYMKSINRWLSPEDYLRLTFPLEDRSIYLVQRLAYTNGDEVKTITRRTKGVILKEIRGQYGGANNKLVSLEGDQGLSIAEIYDKKIDSTERHVARIWHEFSEWYRSRQR